MLDSMKMKYRVEQRADGEWTRWYPQNKKQQNEISRKVVDYMFEIKKADLSTRCKEGTSRSPTPSIGISGKSVLAC